MNAAVKSLYENWIIQHPKPVLLIIALLVIGLAIGLPRFKLDASSDSLTLEHDEDLDFFRQIATRYESGDFLVVTYKPDGDLFSDQALNHLKSMRDDFAQLPGIDNINSILDVPLLYSPLQTLPQILSGPRNLLDEGVDRQLARQEFLSSPIYKDLLLSPDGQTTVMQLNLAVDNKFIDLVRRRDALRYQRRAEGLSAAEQQELEQVSAEFLEYRTVKAAEDHQRVMDVRAIADKYRDNAEIFLGGVTMITADMIDFIRSDLVVFGLGVVLFIIVTLAVIFRQLRFVVLPLGTCLLAVVMMLGFLSWVDWRLTVISHNFVALLLIVTLAITIHLVVRYRELHAKNPDWSQRDLIFTTMKLMVMPCLYTALTTIVAFVSLVVSDIKPVIDFGWMMTIGLTLAFILAFTLLPAALLLMPKGEPKDKGDKSAATTLIFSKIAEKHGNTIVGVYVVLTAVSVYGLTQLVVDNRFIDYFHESTEIHQGMSVIDSRLGGTMPVDIVLSLPSEQLNTQEANAQNDKREAFDADDPFGTLDGGDPFAETDADPDPFAEDDPFADADPFATDDGSESKTKSSYWFTLAGLEEIEQLHDYLESLPEVGKVLSAATAYKVARDINRGNLNDFELAILRDSLPEDIDKLLLEPYLSFEANEARISLRVKETSEELQRFALVDEIKNYAVEEVGLQPQQVRVNGLLVLYNNVLQSLFRSQIVTMGAVFLGIMLMFLVLFRSFTFSVVAIIPNILAAGVILGFMGIIGIPLDLMNIMVAAITVGMGVDHAIHYIYRFKQEFAIDQNYVNAMHRSHASIGRAMYYTSITIIVGFSIFTLSEFIPSIYFGLLTSLAMLAAILGSLTLLPKLILMTKPLGPEAV
jgi:hypothetical protein